MITEAARDRFHAQVQAAVAAGARVLAGGEPLAGPGWFYRPTVLLAEPGDDAPERALEGCFGPVVIVRGVARRRRGGRRGQRQPVRPLGERLGPRPPARPAPWPSGSTPAWSASTRRSPSSPTPRPRSAA